MGMGSGKMSLIAKRDLESLAGLMEKRKDVILAYLFGSQALSEKVHSLSSDIDIAVFFSSSPSLRELLLFRSDLTRLLKTDKVDLVSLNEAPPLLKYEVIVGGRTIYSRDSLFQARFEMKTISHFLDTQYLRSVQNRYLLGGES